MNTTKEFLSQLHELDIKLWVDGDQLRLNAPKGALTPTLREELAARKSEILTILTATDDIDADGTNGVHQASGANGIQRTNGALPSTKAGPITQIARDQVLLLSFAQERLWFLHQIDEDSAAYHLPVALRLEGDLHVEILERSVSEIIRRHEILRTTFPAYNGSAMQAIAPAQAVTIPITDLQHLAGQEQGAEVGRLVAEEAQSPFDLANGPLMRVALLRLVPRSHILLLTMHHIISDDWSAAVIIEEATELYRAFLVGLPSPLTDLPIQYVDFAHWQRQWLQGEVLENQLTYWKNQLAGAPQLLELPTDRPRPVVQTFAGGEVNFTFDAALLDQVRALSRKAGSTLYMTLLAAFNVLLARYSGQDDIVVGTPAANRNRQEIEPLVGFFVNTLLMRTDFTANPTFLELLAQVRQNTLDSQKHQDIPFERLVEELQPERTLSYRPLYQVMFVFANASSGSLAMPGLTITPLEVEGEIDSDDDLMLSLEETEAGLTGQFVYNADLFDKSTIQRMVQHFETLMWGIVSDPEQQISTLPLLSDDERRQLLVDWNDTATSFPLDTCFHQQFEAQVAQTPNAIAAHFEDQTLTYAELNARANGMAHQLVEHNVGPDVVVAILSERNPDFLTTMLAIFKAGGAYLPLNPHAPASRQRQVLSQSQTPLVITTHTNETLLAEALAEIQTDEQPTVVRIEDLLDASNGSTDNLPARSLPIDLAYVIYTSGSTGLPKGAIVEQRGMINHLYAKIQDLTITPADVVAQTAPQSFDISVWQFLSSLLVGGSVHIFPDDVAGDPVRLLEETEKQTITVLEVVPSLMRMMLEEVANGSRPTLSRLRWLIPTGEALPPNLCRQWLAHYPKVPLVNAYGPTECSDDVTHYPIFEPPSDHILNMSIGRPVANMQMYILDAHMQPVPIGVAGELYVGGIGVGRGYLHDPDRTAEAFLHNPFAPRPRSKVQSPESTVSEIDSGPRTQDLGRFYKTGDKARYLPDGNIEFMGRLDYQVKIRGFRIELGEIEAVLDQHPDVNQSVVIDYESQPGNKQLVAYVVADDKMTDDSGVIPSSSHPLIQSSLQSCVVS